MLIFIQGRYKMKRNDYLSWDEYFMSAAILSSMRSKDSETQVGACIVNQKNKIVSLGYNGMPNNCDDDDMPWEREGSVLETKYMYVVHAELNAIINAHTEIENCRLYTTLFPCNECCKAIIQSGISEVIYLADKYPDTESVIASKTMLNIASIEYRQHQFTNRNISFKI